MSDIYDYLNQIRTAVKGKDVRDAIYNGIRQCKEDVDEYSMQCNDDIRQSNDDIRGIKAEIADGRLDEDGVTYTNIGTAIRSQCTDLHRKIVDIADNEISVRFYKDSDTTIKTVTPFKAYGHMTVSVKENYMYKLNNSGWTRDTSNLFPGTSYTITVSHCNQSMPSEVASFKPQLVITNKLMQEFSDLKKELKTYVNDAKDVLEYSSASVFPASGNTSTIYIDASNDALYRYNGSAYVQVGGTGGGGGGGSSTTPYPGMHDLLFSGNFTTYPTATLSIESIKKYDVISVMVKDVDSQTGEEIYIQGDVSVKTILNYFYRGTYVSNVIWNKIDKTDLYIRVTDQNNVIFKVDNDGSENKKLYILGIKYGLNAGVETAYDVAVENGFVGTEAQWLASLKGEPGAPGATGATGSGFVIYGTYSDIVTMMANASSIPYSQIAIVGEGTGGQMYMHIQNYQHSDHNEFMYIGTVQNVTSLYGVGVANVEIRAVGTDMHLFTTMTDGTEIDAGAFNAIQGDFLSSNGFGRLRFYNNAMQYYNGTDWVSIGMTANNNYFSQDFPIQPMQKLAATYLPRENKIKLIFEEPNDTVLDGESIVIVSKVVIVRKKNAIPSSVTDGDTVITVNRVDFGKHATADDALVDIPSGLTPDDSKYYYRAFVYSSNGQVSDIDYTGVTVTTLVVCGYHVDSTIEDPASAVSYQVEYDGARVANYGFTSAHMDYAADTFNYGDWTDILNDWIMPRPCMLKYDGTVDYYLNPNDLTKKEDGSDSDVADVNYGGNAMVEWGKNGLKIWYKIIADESNPFSYTVYFANYQADTDFVAWSFINNQDEYVDHFYTPIYNGSYDNGKLRSLSGKSVMCNTTAYNEITYAKANNQTDDVLWYTENFADCNLINLLLVLIGKSLNTQAVFGQGNTTKGALNELGSLNAKGMFYGSTSTTTSVKVFGMENYWGNHYRRFAGLMSDNNKYYYKMTYGIADGSEKVGYDASITGMLEGGSTPTSTGYISKQKVVGKSAILPIENIGSATTKYCDYAFPTSNGGYATRCLGYSDGASAGAFGLGLGYGASLSAAAYGASISCKPLSN